MSVTEQQRFESPVSSMEAAPRKGLSEFRDDVSEVDHEIVDYRVLNRSAVVTMVIAVLGLMSLVFAQLLVIPVLGVIVAIVGIRTISKFPKEYSGMGLASFGLLANLCIAIGGAAYHIYDYQTEVKEGYKRVSFYELQPPAGYMFPATAQEIDKEKIFIKGYMHPSVASLGPVGEFVLVPDMGTCCFGGQPKVTDMILIKTDDDSRTAYQRRQLKLHGEFHFDPMHRRDFGKDAKGVCYEMKVSDVK
jgi:hypothetical protein